MTNLVLNGILVTITGLIILVIRKIWGKTILPRAFTAMWTVFFLCALCPFSVLRDLSWPEKEMPSIYEYYHAKEEPYPAPETPAANIAAGRFVRRYGIPVYWTGFGLFLIGCLSKVVVTQFRLRRDVLTDLSEDEKAFAAEQELPLRLTGHSGPLVAGVLSKIYLPRDILADEKLLRAVIAHETVHQKRKHYAVLLLAYLIGALYWFLPYVWFCYLKALQEDMEFCSDFWAVSASGLSVREYEAQIMKLLDREAYAVQGIRFGSRFTIKRFRYLESSGKRPAGTAAVLCFALGLFLAGLAGEHYYFYRTDEHGLSRMDVHEAVRTVERFYEAVNADDRERVKDFLYFEYPETTIDHYISDQYEIYDIRYEPDTYDYYYDLRREQDTAEKVIFLRADLHNIPEKEGDEYYHHGYGYRMLQDQSGSWKICGHGY